MGETTRINVWSPPVSLMCLSCVPQPLSPSLPRIPAPHPACLQSALFNLQSLITVLLLLICICTYVRGYRKGIFDAEDGSHYGLRGEDVTALMHGPVSPSGALLSVESSRCWFIFALWCTDGARR